MAGGEGQFLGLTVRRSSQSGDKLTTAAWQTVYTDSDTIPYVFISGYLNLTNLVAGDEFHVRVSKRVSPTGNFIPGDEQVFFGAQTPTLNNPALLKLNSIPDVYGVLVEIIQPAGAFKTIPCEFLVAKI